MVSRQELERRWSLARERMEERGIDVVVAMSSNSAMNGGYARWLTDRPFSNRCIVLFHRNDLMTLVEHGSDGASLSLDGQDPDYPGIGVVHRSGEFVAVEYTHDGFVEQALRDVTRRSYRRVALLGESIMTFAVVNAFRTRLSGLEFVDDVDHFDRLVARKSAEEVDLLLRNVAIQTAAFNALVTALRPGMTDVDAMNIVRTEAHARGARGGVLRIGSAPAGEPVRFVSRDPTRPLGKGDELVVLNETTGPGDYFSEMGRTLVLGRASNRMREEASISAAAIGLVRRHLTPGTSLGDTLERYNDFMTTNGFPPERRVVGHSQGYDIVQRPLVRPEDGVVEEGLFFAVHPGYVHGGGFAWMCDNFLVGPNGSSDHLHPIEQRVIEIDV